MLTVAAVAAIAAATGAFAVIRLIPSPAPAPHPAASAPVPPPGNTLTAPVTGRVMLGYTDQPGDQDNTAGDFFRTEPPGTHWDSQHGAYYDANGRVVYPAFKVTFTNHANQVANVGAFTLIYYNNTGQETGSDSFYCTNTPFSAAIAPGQSMFSYGVLLGGLPQGTTYAQVAEIGRSC
jgi:hypothetical protein